MFAFEVLAAGAVLSIISRVSALPPPHHPFGPPQDWTNNPAPNNYPEDRPVGNVSLPLEPHPIYYFPDSHHKLETLSPRHHHNFLVSSAIPPRLYQIDTTNSNPAILVHEFPGGEYADLFGIAEVEPDIFYTATANLSGPDQIVEGSYVIWEVDMNTFEGDADGTVTSAAEVAKFVRIPEAGCINGLTSIYSTHAPAPTFFLAADCIRGLLWKFDTLTAGYKVAGNESTFKPMGKGLETALGINGIKVRDGELYYTNTARKKMFKIAIEDDGIIPARAKTEAVAKDLKADDFAPDAELMYAYVAGTGSTNVVYRVDIPTGEVKVLAGVYDSTSSPLKTPTAVQFGRGERDWQSIYVTTDGGKPRSVAGSQGVMRFDVDDVAAPFVF